MVGLHLPTLIDAWRDQPERPEYLADPGVFWVVKLMDLGILVPTLTTVGVGILRGGDWARKAAYGALGWFALLGSSVAAMAVVRWAYRVIVYVALMTDHYPPFHLDQGSAEPSPAITESSNS